MYLNSTPFYICGFAIYLHCIPLHLASQDENISSPSFDFLLHHEVQDVPYALNGGYSKMISCKSF